MPARWKLGALITTFASALRETGGPTTLKMGAVTDGQVLQRSGASVAGVTAPFTSEFISGDQTVTFSSTLNVAHGLGGKPKLVQVTLKNVTAEANYSIGDEIPIYGTLVESNASTNSAHAVFDATNVSIITATNVNIRDRSTQGGFTITAANWKYVVRAWK